MCLPRLRQRSCPARQNLYGDIAHEYLAGVNFCSWLTTCTDDVLHHMTCSIDSFPGYRRYPDSWAGLQLSA